MWVPSQVCPGAALVRASLKLEERLESGVKAALEAAGVDASATVGLTAVVPTPPSGGVIPDATLAAAQAEAARKKEATRAKKAERTAAQRKRREATATVNGVVVKAAKGGNDDAPQCTNPNHKKNKGAWCVNSHKGF